MDAATVIMQPAEDLGRVAAQLFLERLQAPKRLVRHVILPTRLIVRASCGIHPPAGDGDSTDRATAP